MADMRRDDEWLRELGKRAQRRKWPGEQRPLPVGAAEIMWAGLVITLVVALILGYVA